MKYLKEKILICSVFLVSLSGFTQNNSFEFKKTEPKISLSSKADSANLKNANLPTPVISTTGTIQNTKKENQSGAEKGTPLPGLIGGKPKD